MTLPSVEAIIFDVGGTLRETARRAPREKPGHAPVRGPVPDR